MGVCKWRNKQSGKLKPDSEKQVATLAISNAICAEGKEESKSQKEKSEVVFVTVFVAHEHTEDSFTRASKIILQLQYENPAHCFIPASIAFEHLYNGDFSQDEIFDIEADLLMNCDQLLIVSNISPIIRREIDFAHRVGMEVIDLAEKYREI